MCQYIWLLLRSGLVRLFEILLLHEGLGSNPCMAFFPPPPLN